MLHRIRNSAENLHSARAVVTWARTGPVQLMLYAVFRIGGATNNIRMDSVRAIAGHRRTPRAAKLQSS